jgi:hypothetical protein
MHKTPQELPEQLALRVDTSPPSIPVSPNYFDPLSEEVEVMMEANASPSSQTPNPPAVQPGQLQQQLRQQERQLQHRQQQQQQKQQRQ